MIISEISTPTSRAEPSSGKTLDFDCQRIGTLRLGRIVEEICNRIPMALSHRVNQRKRTISVSVDTQRVWTHTSVIRALWAQRLQRNRQCHPLKKA